ncbi:hypothetical protein LINGRAHAP2_LOCUS24999 [Linum grandiflorum]
MFCKEPIVVEAWALLVAVRLATILVGSINTFSDCKLLVQALSDPSTSWPWSCAPLLPEIVDVLHAKPSVSITHCHRSRLSVVDRVARSARAGTLTPGWMADL